MKPLLPILLSLLLSTSAFCQSAVDSFFNLKTQKPPENWVELIQGPIWSKNYDVQMRHKSVVDLSRFQSHDPIDNIQFDSLKLTYGGQVSVPLTYLPRKNIFYYYPPSKEYRARWKGKVINVTDQFLSLEWIEPKKKGMHIHFKKDEGMIFIFKRS